MKAKLILSAMSMHLPTFGKSCGAAFTALYLLTTSPLHAVNTVVLLDFGDSAVTPAQSGGIFWNGVSTAVGTSNTGVLNGLVSTTGQTTPFNLSMTNRFNGLNTNGTTSASAPFPTFATQDSLFGNTESFNGLTNIFPRFQLTGLDPTLTYNLDFFASRTGVADNRETIYTVTGATSGTAVLNATENVLNIASVLNITPSAGAITVALAPSAANNNANHFTYLNVLRLTAVPEPSRAMLGMTGALFCLLARRRRRTA